MARDTSHIEAEDETSAEAADSSGSFDLDDVLGGDDFGISDEEVAEAAKKSGFANIGKVELSDADSYAAFDAANFCRFAKPFLKNAAGGRDVVSKSCRIEKASEAKIAFTATDGVAYLRAVLPAKLNKFPDGIVTNFEGIWRCARAQVRDAYLIYENGALYADFFGGKLFLPTYKIGQEVFTMNVGEEVSSKSISPSALLEAIKALKPILDVTQTPELGFVFVEDKIAYATNGVIVAAALGEFLPCIIRLKDVPLIGNILEQNKESEVTFKSYKEHFGVFSADFSYVFPKVEMSLASHYKESIKKPATHYFVDPSFLLEVAGVILYLPENSGIITFKFGENLEAVTATKKGDNSTLILSTSREGDVPAEGSEAQISVKTLLTAAKTFRFDSTVNIGIEDGVVQFFGEGKKQSIVVGGN